MVVEKAMVMSSWKPKKDDENENDSHEEECFDKQQQQQQQGGISSSSSSSSGAMTLKGTIQDWWPVLAILLVHLTLGLFIDCWKNSKKPVIIEALLAR